MWVFKIHRIPPTSRTTVVFCAGWSIYNIMLWDEVFWLFWHCERAYVLSFYGLTSFNILPFECSSWEKNNSFACLAINHDNFWYDDIDIMFLGVALWMAMSVGLLVHHFGPVWSIISQKKPSLIYGQNILYHSWILPTLVMPWLFIRCYHEVQILVLLLVKHQVKLSIWPIL